MYSEAAPIPEHRFPRIRPQVLVIAMECARCAALIVALLGAPLALAQSNRPVVHVFLQLDAKSSVVERHLQQQLPAVDVVVFSRYRDLEDASATVKPDGLIAITPVLLQQGRKPALQGTRGGKEAEPYLLAAVGDVLDGSLSGKTIGTVDVMGREGTQAFVAALVQVNDVKVKRVAKTEDLLPLLEFSAADAILIPISAFLGLSKRTQLDIKSKEAPGGPVGLPALAIVNNAARDAIVRALSAMDATTRTILGIDTWGAP